MAVSQLTSAASDVPQPIPLPSEALHGTQGYTEEQMEMMSGDPQVSRELPPSLLSPTPL